MINANNHNLYEEVPSHGIFGDVIMSMTTNVRNPNPNIVPISAEMRPTVNLLGFLGVMASCRDETREIIKLLGLPKIYFRML